MHSRVASQQIVEVGRRGFESWRVMGTLKKARASEAIICMMQAGMPHAYTVATHHMHVDMHDP